MIELDAPDDSTVLVVVLNDPADLARAREGGWYRIPMSRAPRRIAADFLAFYLTGAFEPGERWRVRWLAPVRGYHIVTRRELIPDEPEHPRAGELYYRVALGTLTPLPQPVPSRRLRRITFIPTTLERLLAAEEINDLWVKNTAQERLWAALKQADLEAERQYPLREELPQYVADFALFCCEGRIAVIVTDEPASDGELRETPPPDYLLTAEAWIAQRVTLADLASDTGAWAERLAAEVERLGGCERTGTGSPLLGITHADPATARR
jgi:hypothetical protein